MKHETDQWRMRALEADLLILMSVKGKTDERLVVPAVKIHNRAALAIAYVVCSRLEGHPE